MAEKTENDGWMWDKEVIVFLDKEARQRYEQDLEENQKTDIVFFQMKAVFWM